MQINANKSKEIQGNPRKSKEIQGNPRKSKEKGLDFLGFLWPNLAFSMG
jgi:hypothetical protein